MSKEKHKTKIFFEKYVEILEVIGKFKCDSLCRSDPAYGKYPESELVKYHGLYYNFDEECEKTDDDRTKYQR